MAIIVFLNQVRAGTPETDRLITYQPSADRSLEITSCIDMVVAVKGRYTGESSGTATSSRFDKFMAHLSFGKSEKVPLQGFESYQGSLESLAIMVEKAKAKGLGELHTWITVVDPTPLEEDFIYSPDRYKHLMELTKQVEGLIDRLGGSYVIISHPAGLLKVELRADEEFSSFDGLNTDQDGSDGLPLTTDQSLTFNVLIISAIALASGTAAGNTRRMTNFPIRQNGFSDFCQVYSLDQKGSELQVSGECSPEPNGARNMGAALFTSHININKCLANVDGNLVPSQAGGALGSCQCDVGFTLCPTCNGTSLQCVCTDVSGSGKKTTLTDMNTFLGIGLDGEGRVVLYCNGVYGEWNQCTKNGAKTDCPPIGK
ncbi:hypothetical protein INS49_007711 [Diaporthe citri]|uniref:uncharacterized protein n=1 Tax=Diaporthe citri TaxID=83186 RepID=UPI001C80F6E4|nr:uncharacterized protein INS49_007711 [Diaporthe citri]KAG6362619.1 hypothetical protein INS49_007711 [Diaporthe citri]